MKKKRMLAFLLALACGMSLLAGCGSEKGNGKGDHLTVYLWNNNMIEYVVPYIKGQLPDREIEFIVGNNNVDRKSTRLNSSHRSLSRMPSSA